MTGYILGSCFSVYLSVLWSTVAAYVGIHLFCRGIFFILEIAKDHSGLSVVNRIDGPFF